MCMPFHEAWHLKGVKLRKQQIFVDCEGSPEGFIFILSEPNISFHNQSLFVHILCLIFNIQWGKKVFSQPPIVQVLPLKKMREACNFHHMYTSTMRDKIRKINPENHIVGFLKNLFANYGGK